MRLPRFTCALAALAVLAYLEAGTLAAEPAALPQTPAAAPAAAPSAAAVPAAPAAPPAATAPATTAVPPAAAPVPAAAAAAAAPPAQPGAGPAAAGKEAPVVLSMLPAMPNVFGGRIEFAEKAFPILAECKAAAVESAIRGAKSLPCQACRGTGKVSKRELVGAPAGVMGNPIWQTWEEDCPACGTFKDVFDVRIAQRLLEVVDRLGHVARDEKFDGLRTAAEAGLAAAFEVRDKTLTAYRCSPVIRTETRSHVDAFGHVTTTLLRTLTGATREPRQTVQFHAEVAPMIAPVWARVGPQTPAGQAVLILGTASDRTEAGGWVWMRMRPAGKGPDAILLCGPPQANIVPAGKIVFGGLMVGRWIPESMAPRAAPVAGAKAPPPPTAGMLPQGMLPVILAVVAREGK